MKLKALSIINIKAATLIALFLTHVVHEAVHALMGLAVGAQDVKLSLFAAQATQGVSSDVALIVVEGLPALVNIMIGLIALTMFRLGQNHKPWFSYLLFLITGFSFLLGFGYLLIDSVFYTPKALGDWKSIITIFNGSGLLRSLLGIIGASGWIYTLFFLAREMWSFQLEEKSRKVTALYGLIIPYAFSVVLMLVLAFINHPLGEEGLLITISQYVFGNSAFLTAFFLSAYWLEYREPDTRIKLANQVNTIITFLGLISFLVMSLFLLPVSYQTKIVNKFNDVF